MVDSTRSHSPTGAIAIRREPGRISLTCGDLEVTLGNERALIGRGPHCRVVLDDPLVSREHALLRISPDAAVLEDLHSANGTYVNNVRIHDLCPLFDGDQILVGTRELRVSTTDLLTSDGPTSASYPRHASQRRRPPGATTARTDAITLLGRLAAGQLASGAPDQAEATLQDHLLQVLAGARAGLPVPASTCATASKYALILAAALRSARWTNYALELHLHAELPMQEQTLGLLEDALRSGAGTDGELATRYVALLRQTPNLGDEGLRTVERLSAFTAGN